MSSRHRAERRAPSWPEVKDDPRVLQAAHELRGLLPSNKQAAILDVGFGAGWFLALFWVVDALYRALKPGGMLMLRTPNMEGPCANSSLYVTLAHEYGFSSGNLASLLDICGFDEIRFHKASTHHPGFKQRLGTLIRWPFLKESQIRHRLFGVNEHGHFDSELIVTGRRGNFPPFFDPKYR